MLFKYVEKALNSDIVVQKMVYKVIKDNDIEYVIETGTHVGHSTKFFSGIAKNVITTEIKEEWLNQAKDYLKGLINIKFCLGDSATILKEELSKLGNDKVFLFLDAHFNNDLALDRELQAIAESNVVPYIMIHDFKVPSREDLDYDGWDGKEYSLENLEHLIKDIYPEGYHFYYNDESDIRQRGCIIIEPKNA